MDRPITSSEAALVRWMLDHASVADASAFSGNSMESLRVIDKWCDCGCASLNFQEDHKGKWVVADALAVYPDGQQAGLILWALQSEIVLLEVHDMDLDSSHRVPTVADLRSYEEMGQSLLTS